MVTIGEINEEVKNVLKDEYNNMPLMDAYASGLSKFKLEENIPSHKRYDRDYIVFGDDDTDYQRPLEYFETKPSNEDLANINSNYQPFNMVVKKGRIDDFKNGQIDISWRTQSTDMSNDSADLPLIEIVPITDTRYDLHNTDHDSIVGTVSLDEGETLYNDGKQYEDGEEIMYKGKTGLPNRHIGKVNNIREVYTSAYEVIIQINVWIPSDQALLEGGAGLTKEEMGIPEVHQWGDFVWEALYKYDSKGPNYDLMDHITLFEVDSGETNDDTDSGYEELNPAVRRWRQSIRVGAYRVFEDKQSLIKYIDKNVTDANSGSKLYEENVEN